MFDSDIHKLCLKKERLRQKYKHSQKTEHYKKYSEARKDIKAAIKSKMRATLNDPSNPNALTKKFWSKIYLTVVEYQIQSIEMAYMQMITENKQTFLTPTSMTSSQQKAITQWMLTFPKTNFRVSNLRRIEYSVSY